MLVSKQLRYVCKVSVVEADITLAEDQSPQNAILSRDKSDYFPDIGQDFTSKIGYNVQG